jgi:hypothetical protein
MGDLKDTVPDNFKNSAEKLDSEKDPLDEGPALTPAVEDSLDARNVRIQELKSNTALLNRDGVKEAQLAFLLSCGKYMKGKRTVSVGAAKEAFEKGMLHNALVQEYFELVRDAPPGVTRLDSEPDWFDCNAADEDGWTAVHHASGEGKLDIVQWLCALETPTGLVVSPFFSNKFCMDLDRKADDQCTPLWVAGFNGQRDVVNQLLLCGADDSIKGAPENEPASTPALACRRNRQPGKFAFCS